MLYMEYTFFSQNLDMGTNVYMEDCCHTKNSQCYQQRLFRNEPSGHTQVRYTYFFLSVPYSLTFFSFTPFTHDFCKQLFSKSCYIWLHPQPPAWPWEPAGGPGTVRAGGQGRGDLSHHAGGTSHFRPHHFSSWGIGVFGNNNWQSTRTKHSKQILQVFSFFFEDSIKLNTFQIVGNGYLIVWKNILLCS